MKATHYTNLKVCNAKITVELLVLPSDVLVQLLELAKNSPLLDVADGASVLEEPVEVCLYLLRFEAGPRPPVHVKHVVVYVLKLLTLSSMDNLLTGKNAYKWTVFGFCMLINEIHADANLGHILPTYRALVLAAEHPHPR